MSRKATEEKVEFETHNKECIWINKVPQSSLLKKRRLNPLYTLHYMTHMLIT